MKSWIKSNALLNSAIWYTVGTFILKGVNFLTVPIFTNLLPLEDFGILTIYSTWSAIFAIVLGLSINGTIGSAKANLSEKEYEEYLSSTLFLGTLSFVIMSLFIMIFKDSTAQITGLNPSIILILLLESFFAFVISFVTSVFTFDRNYKGFLGASAIVTIINVGLSVVLILQMSTDRYIGRIYGGALATIFVGVILYIKLMLRGKKLISLKYWKFCLPIALPLILHNLSHLVLNQADKIMLQKATTEEIVGIYGYTYTIGAIINIIQIALNSAWMPWYYDILKSGDKKELKSKSAIYIATFTALTIMFILGVPEIVKITSPKDYWAGIPLLPLIIGGYYFVFLYTFPANYQFYKKESRYIAMGTIIAAIINVLVNFLLIPKIGVYAAALSTLIAYIVLFFMHFAIVKIKFKHQDFPMMYNWLGIAVVILASAIHYIFINSFIIRWGIILVILTITGLLVLKNIKEFNSKSNQ